MRANEKVSVAWQIVFTIFPVVSFWAFYRIRRLRKYLLYVIIPSIVFSTIFSIYNSSSLETSFSYWGSPDDPVRNFITVSGAIIYANAVGLAFTAFAIYLVIIWSRLHNRRVDASTGQAPGY